MERRVRIEDFFADDLDAVDFDGLRDALAWVQAMAATPQDPRYHAEGDVWTHTRMVCEALMADAEWTRLGHADRRILLTAAVLHDAGKPEVTFTDPAGRIRSPEHALRGESLARRLLWREEQPVAVREAVAALVRQHMQPRYVMEHRDPRRRAFAISHSTRCDHLALLARADTLGRIAPDHDVALDAIAAFVEFCHRHDCLTEPRRFTSDHARFLYFRGALADPDQTVLPPAGPLLTVMSGLPGSGKDTWIAQHRSSADVISLDQIRSELDTPPDAPQEPVVTEARTRLRQMLAEKRDVVWNATTLSRRHRDALLHIALSCDPRVHMVSVDAPPSLLLPRNRARVGRAVVPEDVIERMSRIWQPPDLTEAHSLEFVHHSGSERVRRAS
jgi:predicted kinase